MWSSANCRTSSWNIRLQLAPSGPDTDFYLKLDTQGQGVRHTVHYDRHHLAQVPGPRLVEQLVVDVVDQIAGNDVTVVRGRVASDAPAAFRHFLLYLARGRLHKVGRRPLNGAIDRLALGVRAPPCVRTLDVRQVAPSAADRFYVTLATATRTKVHIVNVCFDSFKVWRQHWPLPCTRAPPGAGRSAAMRIGRGSWSWSTGIRARPAPTSLTKCWRPCRTRYLWISATI